MEPAELAFLILQSNFSVLLSFSVLQAVLKHISRRENTCLSKELSIELSPEMYTTAIYFHPVKGTPEQQSSNWGVHTPGCAQSIGIWEENIFCIINK